MNKASVQSEGTDGIPNFCMKIVEGCRQSPPTASAASLDVSTGRSNFRTEIRKPAVPQIATGTVPIIILQPQSSKHQQFYISLHIQGHRCESRHLLRLWRWCPFRRCRIDVCDNRMDCLVSSDTEQALRPQSPKVGTLTPGATCNMARRVCGPSLRSNSFQRFRIVSHK